MASLISSEVDVLFFGGHFKILDALWFCEEKQTGFKGKLLQFASDMLVYCSC